LVKGVTIGIPVYNEEQGIEKAIRSAADQCERLIVSDNASIDRTGEICLRLAKELSHMEYCRQPDNIGSKSNGLFILSSVVTPYFMFLGGHDYLNNKYVETLKDLLDKNPDVVLAAGRNIPFRKDGGSCPASDPIRSGFLDSHDAFDRVEFIAKDGLTKDGCFILYGLHRTEILKRCLNQQIPNCGCDLIILAKEAVLGRIIISTKAEYFSEKRFADTQDGYFQRLTARKLDCQDMRREMVEYAKYIYSVVMQVVEAKHLIALRPFRTRMYLSIKYGSFSRENVFDFLPHAVTYIAERCICTIVRQAPGSESIPEEPCYH
jgi:glycosyltransferase involved in cell wall biosynthesis